ncbi:chemokine XC receptor 1-like [Melanotaenia boesemani]|uniref:chemokine XC receptor 1-like n=1 Tax=Melanotaenia boesemani TaxID=1250792 RepID=UPI001C05E543|nr:chemokine XC receptor 1-like [Melanotaenia boesemani]XP_041847400.1 chemokine XC receptor 1-like [Melanotaenia boesemani]
MEDNYNMIKEKNYSSEEIEYLCDFFDFSVINGVFLILIFIISVIGNSLLIRILVNHENLKNVTNVFVLNLACSDLIFTFTLPFWATYHLHHWIFSDFLCKFITWAYFFGLYSSVFILTAMTVDRFIIVVLHNWPNNHLRQRKCAMGACTAAWVISFVTSLIDAMKMKVDHWSGDLVCDASPDIDVGYYVQLSLLFFLPFAINIFFNCAIIKTVLKASNKNKQRAIAMVLCVVTAFFICWGPYNILLLIMSFYEPTACKSLKQLDIAYNICRMLAFSHCCLNPLLYMLSQKLRKHFCHLLSCETVCWKNRQNSSRQNISVNQNIAFTAQTSAVMLELHNT